MSRTTIPGAAICAVLVVGLAGCAGGPLRQPPSLSDRVGAVDAAYQRLPESLREYNRAIRELCLELAAQPNLFVSQLREAGVSVELAATSLPLREIEVLDPPDGLGDAGVPVVLGYDTAQTPFHPPEGMFVDATAIYDRSDGRPRLRFLSDGGPVQLAGREYPVAFRPTAAGDHLKARAARLAKSGFKSMLRPASAERSPRIYLLDPYDPDKTPVLMVHGLQSTPVTFAALVNAVRSDPELRAKYQIWQFYYANGTPVLVNAASLRESLAATLAQFDPPRRHRATRDILVVGHSMGGVISHTLVSDSGDRVWESVFLVPPDQLDGDRETIRGLERVLRFERNPAVSRVIFMAAPHRGSPMADSIVGSLGHALARMPAMEERGGTELAKANPDRMTPGAAEFYAGGRFSAVRTLSAKSTALIALSKLPIATPYHSVIGQTREGPVESGSDGVVPYWSSHLDGADSELVVRSGHGVIGNPDAIAEVIRILRLHARP